jgi:hypothetical protein
LLLAVEGGHLLIAPGTPAPGPRVLGARLWPPVAGVLNLGAGSGLQPGAAGDAPRLLPHAPAEVGPFRLEPVPGGARILAGDLVLVALNAPADPTPAPVMLLAAPTAAAWAHAAEGSRYALPIGPAPDIESLRLAAQKDPDLPRPILLRPGERATFRGRGDDTWLAGRDAHPRSRADRWWLAARLAGLRPTGT